MPPPADAAPVDVEDALGGRPAAAARVFQVNVSAGGVPKRPIPEARVDEHGLEGDRVANPRIHGGPDRAVCLYALERILALQGRDTACFRARSEKT